MGAYDDPVELRDDQPTQHEFGSRTYLVADVEPLDVDGVRTVQVGIALWVVGFVAMLPFYGRLERRRARLDGSGPVPPGCGLGLLGLEYCRRRRRARTARNELTDEPSAQPTR